MVFVFLEGYASGAPSYTTCPDANLLSPKVRSSKLVWRIRSRCSTGK
jgi:hypothetical protein